MCVYGTSLSNGCCMQLLHMDFRSLKGSQRITNNDGEHEFDTDEHANLTQECGYCQDDPLL